MKNVNKKYWLIFLFITILLVVLFFANIAFGSVSIPFSASFNIFFGLNNTNEVWNNIILGSRLPQAITAILAGAALSVGGLVLQTFFRNPLADPSVLGISSGASLGVAILFFFPNFIYLSLSSSGFILQNFTVIAAAIIGAGLILLIIISLTSRIRDNAMLLVSGIMISAIASSFIGIMKVFSRSESVHSFAIWGLGSFSMVTSSHLYFFFPLVLLGLIMSLFLIKTLNTLLLGEKAAQNLGLNIAKARIGIIIIVGFLTAVVTAYCGPIAFLGIAIPHISKLILKTSNHAILMPAVILIGALCALVCTLIAKLPGLDDAIPVNAITSLFGAPIVIWIILKRNKNERSA